MVSASPGLLALPTTYARGLCDCQDGVLSRRCGDVGCRDTTRNDARANGELTAGEALEMPVALAELLRRARRDIFISAGVMLLKRYFILPPDDALHHATGHAYRHSQETYTSVLTSRRPRRQLKEPAG